LGQSTRGAEGFRGESGARSFRVFEPDVFAALARLISPLTAPASWGGSSYQDEAHKAQITWLLQLARDRQDMAKDLIKRIFPGQSPGRWWALR
jgi:hypothetical protein